MVYTIILTGETPSKKNSRINTKSGRSFPNARYMRWHNEAVEQIYALQLKGKIQPIAQNSRVKLTVTFYHGDLKRRDSDNQLSSILDTLVDAGILSDDNWQVIPQKEIFDAYDKDNAPPVMIGKGCLYRRRA